jgi:hypothetical protein
MEPGDDELEYQANVRDAGLLTGHRGQQANRFQSTLMEFHRCIRNISVQSQMPVRQAASLELNAGYNPHISYGATLQCRKSFLITRAIMHSHGLLN